MDTVSRSATVPLLIVFVLLLAALFAMLAPLVDAKLPSPPPKPYLLDADITIPATAASYTYLQSVVMQGEGARIRVEDRDHAVLKHGVEAHQIREACGKTRNVRMFQSRSWKTPLKFFVLCQLEDGRWGLRILEIVGTGAAQRVMERTSFIVKDGTLTRALEYVNGVGIEIFTPLSKFLTQ